MSSSLIDLKKSRRACTMTGWLLPNRVEVSVAAGSLKLYRLIDAGRDGMSGLLPST
jgi:hypothetical protein